MCLYVWLFYILYSPSQRAGVKHLPVWHCNGTPLPLQSPTFGSRTRNFHSKTSSGCRKLRKGEVSVIFSDYGRIASRPSHLGVCTGASQGGKSVLSRLLNSQDTHWHNPPVTRVKQRVGGRLPVGVCPNLLRQRQQFIS